MNDRRRILVIGLDGATFDLIKPWVQQGKLPHFGRLMAEGVHGELASTVHPLSPPAWTSFMTGMNPGKHGIFDFSERAPESYNLQFTNGGFRKAKTLWRILSEAGKQVVVIDVPMTYPPEPVNGSLIAAMDSLWEESRFMFPPELLLEICERFGGYPFYPTKPTLHEMDAYVHGMHEVIEHRAEVARFLLRTKPWDFFQVVFLATDRVHHTLWRFMDATHPLHDPVAAQRYGTAIYDVYAHIDEVLGRFMAELDAGTTVLVMSDHGGGPYDKVVNLAKWLEQGGWLRFRPQARGAELNLRQRVLRTCAYSLPKHAWRGFKRWVPVWIKRRLAATFPDLRAKWLSHLSLSSIDWGRTAAYALGNYGNIYINLEGREPQGIVRPGKEYEALRDRIIKALAQLRDPDTGQPILDRAYRREELYRGPYVERAPDIVVVWKDYRYYTRGTFSSEETALFALPGEFGSGRIEHSACHRPNGILLAQGEDVRKGEVVRGAAIIDLAPTILYLSGLPVPVDMDGRVLTELLDKRFLDTHPIAACEGAEPFSAAVDRDAAFSPEEAEQVANKLRALGYLD